MLQNIKEDKLEVVISENRVELGITAAKRVSEKIKELLSTKSSINIIFAAAPSQNEFLAALVADNSIDWTRINAYHMDEYLGLPAGSPELFAIFLKEKIFGQVPFASVNCIDGSKVNFEAECARYSNLLKENPADIVCMGIGENTHIAFNDPHEANFNDPELVKVAVLDQACRQQQVNDGCFHTLEDVPQYAITLTVPALMSAPHIFCMVPGVNKAAAVKLTLEQSLSEHYPSTILKSHSGAVLFVDTDSFSQISA